MKRSACGALTLALGLSLLFAACGGQGASPHDGAPPEDPPAAEEGSLPEAGTPANEEDPLPEAEDPDEGEESQPEAKDPGEGEAPPPEAEAPAQGETPPPETADAGLALALKRPETARWRAAGISAQDFGITEYPVGDPAGYGGAASLSLGKLVAVSLSSDGAASEDLFDELWRRFLEDPDTVLAYLSLLGDQRVDRGDRPLAAAEVCGHIASADAAWYNSIEFGEALAACRERYPTGRIAALLDVLEREHAGGLVRNGWQGAEPSPAPPREPPVEGWRAVSICLEDYGLARTLNDPRFAYIFDHTDTVPLDQLIVFDLWGDALTEGSSEELRSRFLEAPDTVLAYLTLMGDQRVDYWDQPLAAEVTCRSIASADAAWHGGTEEFAQTLADCRERYPTGRAAELLDVLEREHAASMARNQ